MYTIINQCCCITTTTFTNLQFLNKLPLQHDGYYHIFTNGWNSNLQLCQGSDLVKLLFAIFLVKGSLMPTLCTRVLWVCLPCSRWLDIQYTTQGSEARMLMRSFLSSSFVVQFEQIVLLFIHYNIWWPLFAFVGGNSKLIFVLKYYAMLMSLEGFPADATSSHDMLLMSWARCVVSCLYWFVQTFNYFQSHLRIWVTTVKPAVRFQNISYVNSAIKVCC